MVGNLLVKNGDNTTWRVGSTSEGWIVDITSGMQVMRFAIPGTCLPVLWFKKVLGVEWSSLRSSIIMDAHKMMVPQLVATIYGARKVDFH